MTIEQCNGNYNHMYEWKLSNEWYPCHILNPETNINKIVIFTRNGSIMREPIEHVRKMSREKYLNNRESCINALGARASYKVGFHDIDEDLMLFEESNELEMKF